MQFQRKGQQSGPKGKKKKQFGKKNTFRKSFDGPKTRKQIRKSMRADKKAQRTANIAKSLLGRSSKKKGDASANPKEQKSARETEGNIPKTLAELGKFVRAHAIDGKEQDIIKRSKASENTLTSQDSLNKNRSKTKRMEKNLKVKMLEQRKKMLLEENEKEDVIIKNLEKQLKIDKRKQKSLPSCFRNSGLDYILDACDSEKISSLIDAENKLTYSDSEFEDDLNDVMGENVKKSKKGEVNYKGKKEFSELADEDSDLDELLSDFTDEEDEDLDDSEDNLKANTKKNQRNKEVKGKASVEDSDLENDDMNFDSDEGFDLEDCEGSELDEDEPESDAGYSEEKIVGGKSKKAGKKVPTQKAGINDDSDDYSDFQDSDLEQSDCMLEEKLLNNKEKPGKKKVTFSSEVKDGEGSVSRKRLSGDKLKSVSKKTKKELSDDLSDHEESPASGEEIDDSSEYWEDIYGRKRDKQGNVVEEKKEKYIPPHLRMKNVEIDSKKKEELERLKRQLKGLLNRLAEHNMHKIASEIEDIYMRNSRNDMNETLLQLLYETAGTPIITPERLIMEHSMLVAILHANVGTEVGAHLLQSFVSTFNDLLKENIELSDKRLENMLTFICHLYTFKVFDASLLYDILDKLCDGFTEKKIDLILVILRCVGFTLRKDDPASLKNLVLQIQQQAGKVENLKGDSRVRFMLDILLTIKNNNMSKLPQYDPTHAEHLKKILKTMIRKGNYVTELKISLEDLLKADERGKWWIVGSAWNGPAPTAEGGQSGPTLPTDQMSAELSKLAKKLSINTDTRRSIFYILMTGEDYMDAFEKLDKLGMTNFIVREICFIILHCLMSEKEYNQYYALVAQMLCRAHRRNLMTLQCSIWDKIKEVETMKSYQITNFAKFLAFLFLQGSLALSVLKVIPFAEMTKPCVKLVRQVLLTVMCHEDPAVSLEVFTRLTKSDQLKMFREAVRLFLHCFLLPKLPEAEPGTQQYTLKDMMLKIDTLLRNEI